MKVFAIYFPQFYPIELNSKTWGENFTDWNRVKTSTPQYSGHNMPRIPLNKNYYRQDDPAIIESQIKLASNYGISGFDFYHYWFDGELILDKPVELFSTIESKMQFCLTWANESWTKQWDGSSEYIIQQKHLTDRSIWLKHIEYLTKLFKHSNYLKIENKPVFKIYRPELIKNLEDLISYYNNYLKNHSGFDGIYWVTTISYDYSNKSSIIKYFDNSMIFQPRYLFNEHFFKRSGVVKKIEMILRNFPENFQKYFNLVNFLVKKGKTIEYMEFIDKQKELISTFPNCLHSITIDWDNTPRYNERFTGLKNVNILHFKELLNYVRDNYKQEILFINAWNEWAESAYLEPDELHGYQKLEVIKKYLVNSNEKNE